MGRFNETWRRRIIAESLTNFANSHFEDGFADKSPRPDRGEKFFFSDQLPRPTEEIIEHGECFGPDFYRLRAFPQALITQIQAKRIKNDLFFVLHGCHQTSPKLYGRPITKLALQHCPLLNDA